MHRTVTHQKMTPPRVIAPKIARAVRPAVQTDAAIKYRGFIDDRTRHGPLVQRFDCCAEDRRGHKTTIGDRIVAQIAGHPGGIGKGMSFRFAATRLAAHRPVLAARGLAHCESVARAVSDLLAGYGLLDVFGNQRKDASLLFRIFAEAPSIVRALGIRVIRCGDLSACRNPKGIVHRIGYRLKAIRGAGKQGDGGFEYESRLLPVGKLVIPQRQEIALFEIGEQRDVGVGTDLCPRLAQVNPSSGRKCSV